jgi:hypothetical protein
MAERCHRIIKGCKTESIHFSFAKKFIRKATHPHPCPLPSRERGFKNCPSLEGRG